MQAYKFLKKGASVTYKKANLTEKTRKALFAAGLHWDGPLQVGTHQMAKSLLKMGWDVAFISNPISPLHLLRGMSHELRQRFQLYKSGGKWSYDHHLYTYVPGAILAPARKPLLDNMALYESWIKMTFPSLKHKLKENSFHEVDLLFIDCIHFTMLPKMIDAKKIVFRIADRMDSFAEASTLTNELGKKLATCADCTIYTASSLRDYAISMNAKNPCYIPNGVNFSHFKQGNADMPKEYDEIPAPRIIYVGAMEDWFDYLTLEYLAKSLPNISFVCIGDATKVKDKVHHTGNVYFLGRKKHEALPRYIKNAAIGLIPFWMDRNKELIAHINPLKLYEYMACGLPVVSSVWKELEHLQTPAKLYHSKEEALALLKSLLQEKIDPTIYIDYAARNTWDERTETLLKILKFSSS